MNPFSIKVQHTLPANMRDYLTTKQTAALLGIGADMARRYLREGRIEGTIRLYDAFYVAPRAAVLDFNYRHRQPRGRPAAKPASPPSPTGGGAGAGGY